MKEFVKKLIGRLEEQKSDWNYDYNVPINDAIEIVNQLAKEYKNNHNDRDLMIVVSLPSLYSMKEFEEEALQRVIGCVKKERNNGWIPCSERLPKEHGQYLVTVKNLSGFYILEDTVFVCDYAYNEFDFQGWEDNEVIAWQPLPEPYQKGENE